VVDKCKRILTDIDIKSEHADEILKKIKSGKSMSQITKEIKDEIGVESHRELSSDISLKKGQEYLNWFDDTVTSLKKPFKRVFDSWVGTKNSITTNAQTRQKSRASMIASETGMTNWEMYWLINYDRKFQKAFLRELWSTTGRLTENDLAFNLSQAVKKHRDVQLKESNLYGSGMMEIEHYVTSQYHDTIKIQEAGFDKWLSDIAPLLNMEETRKQAKLVGKKGDLLDAYKNIIGEETGGDGILLDTMHLKRILIFNDADSMARYNKIYGHKNVAKAVFEDMDMMDNYLAVGETMGYGWAEKGIENPNYVRGGTEPKYIRNTFMPFRELKKRLLALKDMNKLTEGEYSKLSSALREISGDNYIVGKPGFAKFQSNFQAWQIMTALGKSMFSTVNDIWSAGVYLHFQGISPGKGYYGLIRHMVRSATKQISKEEKLGVFRALKVGIDGALDTNASRLLTGGTIPGLLSEGANAMFHANGMNLWTNSMRDGYASMISNDLANNLKRNFNQLHPRLNKNLTEYGFTESNWKELQKIGSFNAKKYNKKAKDWENYITSDWILENGGSGKLARKIDQFYIRESRLAIPEADASDRVIMYGNHDRGDPWDVTRRLFFQFRTHQVNMARNLYPRMFEIGLPSIVHVLPALGLGYTALSLKSLSAGKEPPDHDSPNLLEEAFIQSGIAPLIGDFIAGEYGRYKHDFDEAIGGTAYSKIKDFGELFVGLSLGNKDASDAWKTLRYNIPFANLFYTEAAVNYGLHYGMMETFSPGSLSRIEAREEGLGTDFLYDPTELWSFGGFR